MKALDFDALQRMEEEVRAKYFPRWDRGRKWLIVPQHPRNSSWRGGICYCRSKLIEVGINDELVLIHEICHSLAPDGHGHSWKMKMLKIADRAAVLGNKRLANRLRKNANSYENENPKPRGIYEVIREIAMDPWLKFRDLLDALASEYDLSRSYFIQEFPWLKQAYKNECRLLKEQRKQYVFEDFIFSKRRLKKDKNGK